MKALDFPADRASESESESGGALTDSELLLAAYLKYRENLTQHVLGDYAFAVWDASTRSLTLGRDATGSRGLYYFQNGGSFRFASEIVGLLACPDIPIKIDERQAAHWLTMNPVLGDGTLYRGITRVPKGHVLMFQNGNIRLHRAWRPEEIAALRLADPAEYAEQLLILLQGAVASRIPADRSIGTHLSSGLDSSTVTVLCAEALAKEGRRATAFTAVPTHPISLWECGNSLPDEGFHAASVAGHFANLDHARVPNDAMPLFEALDFFAEDCHLPTLNVVNAPWWAGINQNAWARGIEILMSAGTGNLTASYGGPFALAELLFEGRLLDWLRLTVGRRRHGYPIIDSLVASLLSTPLVPPLRRAARVLRGRERDTAPRIFRISPINPSFLAACGFPAQMADDANNLQKNSRLTRLKAMQRADKAFVASGTRRRFGIDLVDPMEDRLLVEFCFAIPDAAFCRGGQRRSLIRDAMRGRLPDVVRLEERRGHQAADASNMMRQARQEILTEIRRMKQSDLANKYLDMPTLAKLADEWPKGNWPNAQVQINYEQKLMRGISFGRFVRRFEDGALLAGLR